MAPSLSQPDDDEDFPSGDRCPVCELRAGECDHLVVSLDLTYSEIVSGALFAQERETLDLLEHLAASDPEALKAAGAGPDLEYLATLVQSQVQEGAGTGDAVSIHYPELIATLSHNLQEDGDVLATTVDSDSEEDSSIENLWAKDPEPVVEHLIARYRALANVLEES
ncbi:MAG TPA: hypothetical protein VHB46_17420 [Burkholderiales bacterium]|nr:hypothetical protein [Burkholderiales bacterium]